MKGGVLNTVSIDLSDVKVFLYFLYVGGLDVIRHAPDIVVFAGNMLTHSQISYVRSTGSSYSVVQSFPERSLNQSHHSARGVRGSSMVLAA